MISLWSLSVIIEDCNFACYCDSVDVCFSTWCGVDSKVLVNLVVSNEVRWVVDSNFLGVAAKIWLCKAVCESSHSGIVNGITDCGRINVFNIVCYFARVHRDLELGFCRDARKVLEFDENLNLKLANVLLFLRFKRDLSCFFVKLNVGWWTNNRIKSWATESQTWLVTASFTLCVLYFFKALFLRSAKHRCRQINQDSFI